MSESFGQSGQAPDEPESPAIQPDPVVPWQETEKPPAGKERERPQGRPGLLEAEVTRYEAETALKEKEWEDASKQIEAQIESEREQMLADIRDREKRTDAENADQARRTGAEMSQLESETENRRKLTDAEIQERRFCMIIIAVGVIATVILSFLTAGQSGWGYRLMPGTGLLISGGGALRLRSIALNRDGRGKGEKRDDDESQSSQVVA